MPAETPPEDFDPRDRRRYYLHETAFRRLATPLARAIFGSVAEMHVSGVDNLPEDGPVILAANHMTNFDVFPMQFALPRPIFFMAKAELHHNPILDAALRQLGSFPVERGARDEWALRQAQKVLEHDQVLGIFPEGKRNKGLGLHPAKTGAARLAIAVTCPILPLAVDGTQRLFNRFPRRTLVRITVGNPIYPLLGETALALTDRVMFALAEMLPPRQRGVYARRPAGF